MTSHRSRLGTLALSTFLLTVPLHAALAQDATTVADRLKASLALQSIDITWTNVAGDASEMTLEGVTIKPAGEANALPIGNVTLTDVTEEDGGAYRIETLSTQAFNKTEDGITLDISEFVLAGMTIPSPTATDPLESMMLYESGELASLTVQVGDKTAFAMNGLGFELTPPEAGRPMEFTGAAEKFTADLTLVEDPQSRAVIEAMGYQQIAGFMEMAGSWNPVDGRLALSQYDISVEDAGTFGMNFDLGGYTLDFIKSLQETSKKLAEAPAGGDNSAAGLAMLGLMQQLSINGASMRWDDDSLTGKVLEFVGRQQGVSAADMANQVKALVPFGMAQLNNPELAAQVSAAVNAYLDDQQNIEIAAAPPAPVPFAMIMAGAMTNPLDLTRTLGVKVTANQQ